MRNVTKMPSVLACLTLSLSLLTACGGGGGGGTTTTGGSGGGGGGGSTASCPTYAVGDKFTYHHSSVITYAGTPLPAVTYTRTVTVTNTTSGVADMQATFSNSADVDNYYHDSTATVFALKNTTHTHAGGTDTSTYTTPFQFCPQPSVGTIYTANVQLSTGQLSSVKSEITAVATESVTVPAGTYATARRVDYLTKVYDSTGAYLAGSDVTSKVWFDDVVGVVKEETSKTISASGFTGSAVNTITLQSFP